MLGKLHRSAGGVEVNPGTRIAAAYFFCISRMITEYLKFSLILGKDSPAIDTSFYF
jgi:hypothetical protein